jgi:RNA polymerase sigma-70 factor (ECF subfamily)
MTEDDPAHLEAWVHRLLAGSRGAADRIVKDRLPRIRSLIHHVVGQHDELDDMVQVAMITVLRGFPTFRGEGDLGAWIDRVAVRSAFAYAKQRRIRTRRVLEAADDFIVLVGHQTLGERVLDRRRLASFLERLPPEQRQAVVLHHMMGLSVPEIVEEIGVPFETVRTRLRAGLIKLRAVLDESV